MSKADNLPASCAVVTKSGNLNFLDPSGPLQACNRTAVPFSRTNFTSVTNGYAQNPIAHDAVTKPHPLCMTKEINTPKIFGTVNSKLHPSTRGPGSSVGKATGYELEGSAIESRWGRDFPHLFRPDLEAHSASSTMGTVSFPGLKSGRGVTLTPHNFQCRGQEK